MSTNDCDGKHRSPTRNTPRPRALRSTDAKEIPILLQDRLELGNLDTKRDWGYAGDYLEAMWRMLQQEQPGDYVVATGVSLSIRDFLGLVFELDLDWKQYVKIDTRLFRPAEVDHLEGDPEKARRELGWQPRHDVRALAKMMVESDLKLAEREKALQAVGYTEPVPSGY